MIGSILLIIAIYWFLNGTFYRSLLLFFLFLTNGLQLIPSVWLMSGLPLDKPSDLAIIYVMIVVFLRYKMLPGIVKQYPVFKWCLYIVAFVFMDALYSYFLLSYSLSNIIQVFRPYLLFFSFLVFFLVPTATLYKVFHTLALITVFQSLLFLSQIVTGEAILLSSIGNENVNTNALEGSGYIRFYNSPSFLLPALFYFLFVYKYKSKAKQYLILVILFLTVLGPMHRSFILALVAVLSIYTLLRQNSSKRITYSAIIGLCIYAVSYVPVISNRMEGAFSDIRTTFSSDLKLQSIDIGENTAMFRIGHFLERFDYVLAQPEGWLFGIGLISDNAPYAAKLPFQFGLISEVTGQVVQIDTGDLIWSPLFLTLGFVGTALYIAFFIRLMVFFFRNSTATMYSAIGFVTILFYFFISMVSTEMLNNNFRVIILMLAVIVCNTVAEGSEINETELTTETSEEGV